MKKCSYCAEEILDEAIKCKHCGEFLNTPKKEAWYFKNYFLVIALLTIGPLALPLLWFNARFSSKNKVIMTVLVMVLTYYLGLMLQASIKTMTVYYKQILG